MIMCPNCGQEIKEGAKECKHCGELLPQQQGEKKSASLNHKQSSKSNKKSTIRNWLLGIVFVIGGLVLVSYLSEEETKPVKNANTNVTNVETKQKPSSQDKVKVSKSHSTFESVGVEYRKEPYDYENEVYAYKDGVYTYKTQDFSSRLYPIEVDYKRGFINGNGEVVIEPQFGNVGEFSEGLAPISFDGPGAKNAKIGFIDEKGNVVIEPQFELVWGFSEGVAPFSKGNKWGFIDRTGNVVIEPRFEMVDNFSEGVVGVTNDLKGGEWSFIDKTGKVVLEAITNFIDNEFSEGLLVTKVGGKDGKFGYVDTKGNIVIEPRFDVAFSFSEGLALVCIGNKCGFIDKDGRIVIKPTFELLGVLRGSPLNSFSEGLARLKVNGKYGFIDRTGNIAIEPQFDEAEDFSSGYALVRVGDKYGYIDRTGALVFEPQFKDAKSIDGDLAKVSKYSSTSFEWVYVDRLGKIVWSSYIASLRHDRQNKPYLRDLKKDGNLARVFIKEGFQYWVHLDTIKGINNGVVSFVGMHHTTSGDDIEQVEMDCVFGGYRVTGRTSNTRSLLETGRREFEEEDVGKESEWSSIGYRVNGGLTNASDFVCGMFIGEEETKTKEDWAREEAKVLEEAEKKLIEVTPPTPDQPKHKITVKKVPRIDCETPDGRIIFQGVQEGKCPKGTIEVKKIIEKY